MKHHLLRNFDVHECMYCSHDLSGLHWLSHFEIEHHYKSVICVCGRRNMIKVRFYGSGHDTWKTNIRGAATSFEQTVEKEHEKVNG